ncbi:MAG: hypothetical protein I3273_03570 [Candidatus Moeniiplasma glomeromycotorum]|nr:hypothetical protein [Candidatus Moeniiplasma glomeromycotorum]MCE8169178.1 hypothetical protein [Candidatus Moeniiplasma glomeromycotorum]
MRIKKWEKWYWGIVISLATFFVVGFCVSKEVKITIGSETKKYTDFADKLKYGLIVAGIIVGVAFLIWLLIRLFSKND